jgi:LPXTG-motif cell wall-anchored protein
VKKGKILSLILSVAIAASAVSGSLIGLPATAAAADQTIIDFGSTGWSWKKNVTETAMPTGGFTLDSSWTSNVKLPIGFAGAGKPMDTSLASGTKIDKGTSCPSLTVQKNVTINNLDGYSSFTLDADIDDGGVLFVNGVEAALLNAKKVSDTTAPDITTLGYRRDVVVGNDVGQHRNVTVSKSLFKEGNNVVTLLLLNDTTGSSDIYGDLKLVAIANTTVPSQDATPEGTSIAKGAEWLWLKNGTGTTWLEESFAADSSWAKNAAPVGYGYTGVSSVPSGSCSNVYLRRVLNIADMSQVKSVVMNLSLDDSATVYFNGVKAHATFNEGGTVDKTPYESSDVRVAPTGLHVGKNIISVNLINVTATSSDIYFDMSLQTSTEDVGFQGEKFVMTPGKNASELGFAWYTPYERGAGEIYFVPNTADETKYSTSIGGQVNGEGGRFHDGNATSVYKLPLDKTKPNATLLIDISQNYTIQLSGDGVTWGTVIADPTLAGVGECGNSNREKKKFDLSSYITAGNDYIFIRVGDQTTANGWGGIVWSVQLVSGTYPPASLTGAAVQIAKKSDMTGDTFPSGAKVADGTIIEANAGFASNKVTVTDLDASTEYSYRYGNKNTNSWSPVYTFKTQKGGDSYKAIFVGDPQIGGSGNDVSDGVGWNTTLNKAMTLVPDASFILSGGDQVDHCYETEYTALTKADQFKKVPFAPTMGNHDGSNPSFTYHYNMPNVTNYAKTGAGTDYYFSYGNTLIMVLNGNNENIAEHKAAMQAAIASHTDAKWRIVLMHQDVYGAGKHASEPESEGITTVRLRKNLVPVFEELKVDLALTGHDHTFARSFLMKDQLPQKDQLTDAKGITIDPNGILYITGSCSSGAKFYDLVGNSNFVEKKLDIKVPQFSSLDVTNNQFTIKTYRADTMTVIDEVSLKKAATKEDMNTLLDTAGKKVGKDHTVDSFSKLKTAVKGAQNVLEVASPTDAQMNSAYRALSTALNGLVLGGNKATLSDVIETAEKLFNEATVGTNEGEYPQAAKDAYLTALNAAKAVFENEDATEADLQQALAALNTATAVFKTEANIPEDPSSTPEESTPDESIPEESTPDESTPDESVPTAPGSNNEGNTPETGDNTTSVAISIVLLGLSAGAVLVTSRRRKTSK